MEVLKVLQFVIRCIIIPHTYLNIKFKQIADPMDCNFEPPIQYRFIMMFLFAELRLHRSHHRGFYLVLDTTGKPEANFTNRKCNIMMCLYTCRKQRKVLVKKISLESWSLLRWNTQYILQTATVCHLTGLVHEKNMWNINIYNSQRA